MPLSRYLDKFIILGNSALNKQLGADANGNIYTHENKLWWETWAIEVAGDDGRVFLRSDHGKLLTSTAQGALGSSTNRGEAEQWRVEPAAGGGVFVRSVQHGKLLSVLPNGTPTTTANTSAAEIWRVEEMAPALKFDGTDGHVALPPMNPDFSQGFTIEAWVRHEAFGNYSRIVDLGNGPSSDNIVFANTGTSPDLNLSVLRGDQVKVLTAPGALPLNAWTHVAATVDAAGFGRLYKNGAQVAQGQLWLPNNTQRSRNYVGKSNWADALLRGLASEVRLWTYARSGEQIQAAMNRRLHGDEAGLFGYWPLDAAAGLVARDHSGNGRHGAVVGEASWVAPRLTGRTYAAPGEEIKVSSFSGTSRVRLPAMTLDFSGGCTVEAWVRPQAAAAWSRVFEMHTTYGGDHVMLLANGDGTGFGLFAIAADGGDKGLYAPAGTLPTGRWTHICGVLDPAGQVRLYANGKLVASGPAQLPKAAARPNVMIGNSPEGSPFAGLIAEVRVWTCVRSEAQIQDAMARGLTGHERGLAGYWKLDEDSGASARDSSPYGRAGTREEGCVQVTSLLPIEARRALVTTVTHEGKVLVFATRADGRVQYTVKQSGFEDTVAMTGDARPGWEPWRDLELPAQADDTSVIAREAKTLTYDGDTSRYVLCSRYHTAADTAIAPVQVVSGFGFLYVFRQSTAGTLLVDRFVLDGMTNQLVPKVEVRFKRSRKRHEPLLPTSGAADQTFDSLDFSDTAGVPFYEPSTELRLIAGVHDGLFAVVLLPTRDVDRQRWHFFVHGAGSKVEVVSILSSETGLFDPQQRTSSADGSLLPGVERTVIDLGAALQGPVRSLCAVRYDLQEEQATASGARMLLRTAVRVMLVAAGSQGTPVLSFAAATDGTLSRLADAPTSQRVLHSERRELLLPLDTLENVVAAQVNQPVTGAIAALRRGSGDKVAVQSSGADKLKIGDSVEIRGTRNYNGRFLVKATGSDTFEIEVDFAGLEDGIGRWEKVVTRETGLTFDGAVTSYRRTPEGKLIVTAPNHGLVIGDAVQITGTAEYNSIYPVTPIDAGQFALEAPWALGSAIGVKRLASLKRRGVNFDGVDEYVAVRDAKVPTGATSYTVEAWIRPRSMTAGGILAWGEHGAANRVTSLSLTPTGLRHEWGGQDMACNTAPLQDGWHHVAASYDAATNTRRLYLDGAPIATDAPAAVHDVPTPVTNFTIGRVRGEHFAGSIADVRVWSVARSDAQIASGMFEPINGQEEALCGCWKLGALEEVDPTPWALAFAGDCDCALVPDTAALRVQRYTVEVWIKPERPTQEWVGLVGKPGRNYNIWLNRDGFVHHRYHTNTGTTEGPPDTPRGTIRWGEWNHIAITNDGQTARTFHDGIERASGSLAGKTLIVDQTPLIIGRNLDDKNVEYYTGLLTELRLWSRARTAPEIAADRGRSLAGDEADLVAYWRGSEGAGAGLVDVTSKRLDATVTGGARAVASDAPVRASTLRVQRAYDFSPNGSHGLVVGTPSVSNVQIQRAENAQYRNDDLVAVVRGGVYEESVELRPLGGTLTGLKFAPWFKKSQESAVPDATLSPIAAPLVDIGGGWFRASCQFAVPPTTSLMRAFKLVDVAGTCTAMELRRHRLVELPAAITEWEYAVTPALAPTSAAPTDLGVKLAALAASERSEGALLLEKRVLEDKLAFAVDPNRPARIAAVQAEVTALEAEHTRLSAVRAQHQQMPMFSYCRITPRHSGMALAIDGASNSPGADLIQVSYRGTDNELFYADPNQAAGQVTVPSLNDWFLLRPGHNNGMVVDVEGPSHDNGARLHQWIYTGGDNQRFRFEAVAGVANTYVIRAKHSGKVLDVYDGSSDQGEIVIQYDPNNDANQQFTLQVVRDSPITIASRVALEDCNRRLVAKRAELEQLRAAQQASQALRDAWQARLTAIDGTELPAVRAAIDGVNGPVLAAMIADQASAPQLATLRKEPKRGLTTLGAQLAFVRPPGRITAAQTCDGDVQLSWLDVRGRMRELRYQATRDGKGASFDVWRPTLGRAGLNFRNAGDIVRLDRPVALGDDWTVEAWFQTPLPKTAYCNTLFGVIGECEILVKDNMLGMWLRGIVDCGFDVSRLATGWHHLAVVASGSGSASTTSFYIDGQRVGDLRSIAQMRAGNQARLDEIKNTVYKAPLTVVTVGNHGGGGKQFGRVAEVRLWSLALKDDEIAANSRTLLTGREPGLVAYYPMTEAQGGQLRDVTGRGNHGSINGAPWVALDAPIGRQAGEPRGEAMVVAEYDTIGQRPGTAAMMALMRRAFAVETARGVRLFAEQRVEELDLRWVGNAQFQPTLLGYIEGPPPVPSENLTMSASYNGAASVELSTSDDVTFQWNRSKDEKLGNTTDLFLGWETNSKFAALPLGIGTINDLAKVRLGFKGAVSHTTGSTRASTISAQSSLKMIDRLELRGTLEDQPRFPQLGSRFIPKNVGYALVVSGLADVFVTSLRGSGRMVGYEVVPNADIPPDVNTVSFLINPAYTMAGSLDGMTGSAPTSDRFFAHVPELRAQYGSRYPASYYRLQEAYDLKRQIAEQDKRREAYFFNFNASIRVLGPVGDDLMAKEIDKGEAPGAVTVRRQEDTPVAGTPAAAADSEALIEAAGEQQDEYESRAAERRAQIEQAFADREQLFTANRGLEQWQSRMEDLRIRAGKRNIVNTYVWDANGGLHTEQQQFANSVQHNIGSSASVNFNFGLEAKFFIGVKGVELTTMATMQMSQTLSKTVTNNRGFGLGVSLSGVESRGVTDHKDRPLVPGEKVGRYRFMSFYLEGATQHFDDFFAYVVDPEWLSSNSENARALRDTRGRTNKAWRVLHRVTYVERPALANFGADLRPLPAAPAAPTVDKRVEGLEQKVDLMLKLLQAPKSP
ncbi:LamG-like jellyroll fold domain-containing protein [Nannocystis pusilla]|uniref:LamG-like jellyroll fold domain-containing protein n=1 Tax=Nannocystis pusilla TaxID=889268 RepID=UPI003BF1492D